MASIQKGVSDKLFSLMNYAENKNIKGSTSENQHTDLSYREKQDSSLQKIRRGKEGVMEGQG